MMLNSRDQARQMLNTFVSFYESFRNLPGGLQVLTMVIVVGLLWLFWATRRL